MAGVPPWERLPATTPDDVPQIVKTLARQTAGLNIRFISNTNTLHLCWTMPFGIQSYTNWSANGVSGIDVYYRLTTPGAKWRWAGNGDAVNAADNQVDIGFGTSAEREFIVYLPSDRRIAIVRTDIPAGYTMRPASAPLERPIVVYTSSIGQGVGTSRSGVPYPQQLGRMLDRDAINLGFMGECKMQVGMAQMMGQIDASAFVVDCFPNMTAAMISERMFAFVDTLASARPDVPIYIVQDRLKQSGGPHPTFVQEQAANKAAALAELTKLQAVHSNLHWIPADNLLCGGDEDVMADDSHPSDLGARCYANELKAQIDALN